MENRYCENYIFKKCSICLVVSNSLHLFKTFQNSAFSSGCQSRFFLDMPENLQWNSCSHGWLRESHPTVSAFAAGEVPDRKVQKPKSQSVTVQQSLSHLELCFLTTLQYTSVDFTDTSLDILVPLSKPEPELA